MAHVTSSARPYVRRLRRVAILLPVLLVGLLSSSGVTARSAHSPVPGASNCPVFPTTNVWNQDISTLPVATNSQTLLTSMGLTTGLHPDFGSKLTYGIPYNVTSVIKPWAYPAFTYAGESDAGPYPIPQSPAIESSSDHHMLIIDKDNCHLYEMWNVSKINNRWRAGSGAIWDLNSNALRPDGWTSADAAGLPVLPGLVRYNEVATGLINHALRFTVPRTRTMHIYPARHDAGSSSSTSLPPMGLRVRLKASVSLAGFSPQNRVILTALKRYGMMLADNGSAWYISGASDSRWNDSDLHLLNRITGSNFEVVNTSNLVNSP